MACVLFEYYITSVLIVKFDFVLTTGRGKHFDSVAHAAEVAQ